MPNTTEQREAERRVAWDRYAASFLQKCEAEIAKSPEDKEYTRPNYDLIARCADTLLKERDVRFPKPE